MIKSVLRLKILLNIFENHTFQRTPMFIMTDFNELYFIKTTMFIHLLRFSIIKRQDLSPSHDFLLLFFFKRFR